MGGKVHRVSPGASSSLDEGQDLNETPKGVRPTRSEKSMWGRRAAEPRGGRRKGFSPRNMWSLNVIFGENTATF